MAERSTGLFLTLEGIEGAGKSTQAHRLAPALEALGHRVVLTREPGGGRGRIGDLMRDLLKDPAVWSRLALTEIFLYAAARAHHLESLVQPELDRGAIVLCDRFLDSTRAYQGFGRGRPIELIEALHRLTPLDTRPDRTILLDVDPEIGLSRARSRTIDEKSGYDDADLRFFTRVRDGYLTLARQEPERIRVVDAASGPDAVHHAIVELLVDLVPGLEPLTSRR
ncbi:MAG: dTMP kinase [Acidobacteriota bacterium]|nr:dTMP kinase [Acidobacteriota bacterium]